MVSAPSFQQIKRRRTRKCRWCGNPRSFMFRGREKNDPQHDLCEDCWAQAQKMGYARWQAVQRRKKARPLAREGENSLVSQAPSG